MTDVSILHYRTVEGGFPYREWIESIAEVDRLAFGTFGDWKAVGEGVRELRVQVGAGHRVYFRRDGDTVVILLCGIKRSQDADTRRAKSVLERL